MYCDVGGIQSNSITRFKWYTDHISCLHTVVPSTYLHLCIKTQYFCLFSFQRSWFSSATHFDHLLKYPLSAESHLAYLRKYCAPKTPRETSRLTTWQVAEGTRSGSLQLERIRAHKRCQYRRDSK